MSLCLGASDRCYSGECRYLNGDLPVAASNAISKGRISGLSIPATTPGSCVAIRRASDSFAAFKSTNPPESIEKRPAKLK